MYLFQKIDELTFSADSRKIIANFVLNKGSKLNRLSMKEIAELTFTSKPTLTRFAKTLGYSGWREFIQAFTEEAHHQETHYSDIDPNLPFSDQDTIEDIINKISSLHIESILDTADLIDVPTLEEAVDNLINSNRILLFGLSPNSLLAEPFRRKMQAIGMTVIIPPIDEGGLYSYTLTSADCAMVISYSGNRETTEPMRFIKTLKKNQVALIGITGGGNNYIRNQLKCVLTISSRERLYSKIAGFSTEMSIITILNILYSCCFARNYQKNWKYKLQNATLLETERNATLSEMKEQNTNELTP